ncbi:MAG: hypothetical protein WC951_12925 [Bacteroidales bacterium]
MKHKKTIGGLILLASLALAGCNVRDGDSTDPSTTVSDSSTTSVVPSDDTSNDVSTSTGGDSSSSSASSFEPDPPTGRALRTKADLELLRQFPADEFHLMNDIDLSGADWVPIPSFSGTFNGRNNKLIGLTIEEVPLYEAGFFIELYDATINDLTFANPKFQILVTPEHDMDQTMHIGILAARHERKGDGSLTTLNNVNVAKTDDGIFSAYMSIVGASIEQSAELEAHVGGLIGISEDDLTITNSDVYIHMMGPIEYGGGLIGTVNFSTLTVSDVMTAGETIVSGNIGGVVGLMNESPATFTNVHNSLALSLEKGGVIGGIVAGILGDQSDVTISDSSHSGHISMIATGGFDAVEAAGGIVGVAFAGASLDLINVSFKSDATFSGRNDNLGGLVGLIDTADVTIKQSFVEKGAHLAGHNTVGGLVAFINSGNLTIDDSYVAADISGKIMSGGQFQGGLVAGLLARADDALVIINDSYFAGNVISSQTQAGALIGNVTASTFILNRIVAYGTVTANSLVSNLIGSIVAANGEINDVYYALEVLKTDGSINDDPQVAISFRGTAIEYTELDSDFFATTLVWDSAVWDYANVDFASANYPTLK